MKADQWKPGEPNPLQSFCCLHLRSWRPDHAYKEWELVQLSWDSYANNLWQTPPFGTHIFLWSQIDVPLVIVWWPNHHRTPGYKIQNRWTITWIGSYNIKSSNCILYQTMAPWEEQCGMDPFVKVSPPTWGKPKPKPAPKSDAENSHFRFECSVLATWSDTTNSIKFA